MDHSSGHDHSSSCEPNCTCRYESPLVGATTHTCHYESPLGGITLASNGDALVGLSFNRQENPADPPSRDHGETSHLSVFVDTIRWLDTYFEGHEPGFTPPLCLRTTPFRRAVWEILLTIPYGQTMTYGQIAHEIARQRGVARMSAQAVGGAVGHNDIALIIPCHRVVGSNGSLTGYASGIYRKVALLELEGVDMEGLWVPTTGTAL